ncbi:HD-GYP domain-containing protein [Paenibacillus sp. DYY-L-2]|uniref:HD-GYP domain-containing protein n=1 Tax=Paenibacillus sp. DYY-L-2 TaxID=3447013 RepID=UPI003F502E29
MGTTSSLFIEQLKLDQEPDASKWLKALQNTHPEIYYHCSRVSMLAEKIALQLKLPEHTAEQLIRGCFMHDIGKTVISRELLTQRSPLNEKQWEVIKLHPVVGARMAESNPGFGTEIIDVIKYHHERWDGRGYPYGLKGEDIPLGARICAVLDAFDSMTSNIKYRRILTLSEARLELIRGAGSQFDPDIVHAMMRLSEQTLDIYSL